MIQSGSQKPDPVKKVNRAIMAMSLGTTMAVGMIVFTALGYWIDQKTGGGQGWTLAGMFLGLFYCGYEVWKLLQQQKDQEK